MNPPLCIQSTFPHRVSVTWACGPGLPFTASEGNGARGPGAECTSVKYRSLGPPRPQNQNVWG